MSLTTVERAHFESLSDPIVIFHLILTQNYHPQRKSHFAKVAEIDRIGIKEKEKLKMMLLTEMKEAKEKLSSMASESLTQTRINARKNHNENAEKLHRQGLVGTKRMKENVAANNTVTKKKRDIELSNEMQATMASREIAFQVRSSLISLNEVVTQDSDPSKVTLTEMTRALFVSAFLPPPYAVV